MPDLKLPDVVRISDLGALFSLLPGSLSYLVRRSLREADRHTKIDSVDAVLHALAYTFLVHGIWLVLKSSGSLIPTPDLVGLSITAVSVGIGIAWISNNGYLIAVFRRLRVTSQPRWPEIWNNSANEARRAGLGEYVVIELRDQRRALGGLVSLSCPVGGAELGNERAIVLSNLRWLHSIETQPEQPGWILIRLDDVCSIQFLPPSGSRSNGITPTQSTQATTTSS